MKFSDFLNELHLDEGLSTVHSKVEMSLRELDLKYKTETENTGKLFVLDNGFVVVSRNNGNVSLHRQGIKGEIASIKTLDFNKIRELVTNMLKAKLPAIKAKETKEKEPKGVAKRLRSMR